MAETSTTRDSSPIPPQTEPASGSADPARTFRPSRHSSTSSEDMDCACHPDCPCCGDWPDWNGPEDDEASEPSPISAPADFYLERSTRAHASDLITGVLNSFASASAQPAENVTLERFNDALEGLARPEGTGRIIADIYDIGFGVRITRHETGLLFCDGRRYVRLPRFDRQDALSPSSLTLRVWRPDTPRHGTVLFSVSDVQDALPSSVAIDWNPTDTHLRWDFGCGRFLIFRVGEDIDGSRVPTHRVLDELARRSEELRVGMPRVPTVCYCGLCAKVFCDCGILNCPCAAHEILRGFFPYQSTVFACFPSPHLVQRWSQARQMIRSIATVLARPDGESAHAVLNPQEDSPLSDAALQSLAFSSL